MAYAFLAGRVDALTRIMARREDWAAYYQGLYADDRAGWRAAHESIRTLASACAARGIPLLLANHRELGDYRFKDVDAKLRRVAAENGVPLSELRDTLRDHDEATLWVTPPDPHPKRARQCDRGGCYLGKIEDGIRASVIRGARSRRVASTPGKDTKDACHSSPRSGSS